MTLAVQERARCDPVAGDGSFFDGHKFNIDFKRIVPGVLRRREETAEDLRRLQVNGEERLKRTRRQGLRIGNRSVGEPLRPTQLSDPDVADEIEDIRRSTNVEGQSKQRGIGVEVSFPGTSRVLVPGE